jgi:Zinc carboxypeptidase
MARTRALIPVVALALATATPARGACVFVKDQITNNDEITNPFEPGCGDVMLTYTKSDDMGNNVALGYAVPIPVDSLTPVDGFRSYASLFARHQALLTMHGEVDGQVVGQTLAGREIWAYRLGDSDTTTADGFSEGAMLVNGGIHAREWQTPEAVTGLMEAIVDGKADGGFGQYLVENLTTVLLPVNNVDGFLQTQRFWNRTTAAREQPRDGRMRRKNMRNPQTQGTVDEDLATVGDNFWGIDVPR